MCRLQRVKQQRKAGAADGPPFRLKAQAMKVGLGRLHALGQVRLGHEPLQGVPVYVQHDEHEARHVLAAVGTLFLLRALQKELAAVQLDDGRPQINGAVGVVQQAQRGRSVRLVEQAVKQLLRPLLARGGVHGGLP